MKVMEQLVLMNFWLFLTSFLTLMGRYNEQYKYGMWEILLISLLE